MMSTTTANPPHSIGVPTECILFSLHIKNKNGHGQKTIAVSFLCIDLAFRQGLTYNHEGCPATGCGFARIVMTIHRRRSYSPFAGNKLCQTIGFVNGLHDFITQFYATASTFTPSAGKITPVCRRISVCSFAVVRLIASPGWFTSLSSTRRAKTSAS